MEFIISENINLSDLIEKVNDDRDSIIVRDSNGKSMVALALEDYESLMETFYLLSSKANSEHLFASIKEYEEGKIKNFSIDDLAKLEK